MSPMNESWRTWAEGVLEGRAEQDLLRRRDVLDVSRRGERTELSGHNLTLFSSNDYLGLSSHPAVVEALCAAARKRGLGLRASPLVCGHTRDHEALEEDLARLKKTSAALLFSSGFAANLATISVLGSPDTEFFSDRLNHASLIDGTRLGRRLGATVSIYEHADAGHLEDLLKASNATRKVVITDGVFSMDGDLAPLPEIVELKNKYGFLLVVDDAHGTLVLGETGAGAAESLGLAHDAIDIHIGTLSKAFGAHGGFICTSRAMRDVILNRGRSYVYSTALPTPVVCAARASLEVFRTEPAHRRRLDEHRSAVSTHLGCDVQSAIVPILLGTEKRALDASNLLLQNGIHVSAIRPPTVPAGTSRLRIALNARHHPSQVDNLLQLLDSIVVEPA